MLTKYNFEEIDEALHSESKWTTNNQILNNGDESDFNMFEKEKWTKRRILENISFDTTQYDIYNPDWDSCDIDLENEREISIHNDEDKLAENFLGDYEISLKDFKPKKKVSPIRIHKKTKLNVDHEHSSKNPSFISRNLSQNTVEKDWSSSARARKRGSKFIVSAKKKKKLRITKKRKQPYNYAQNNQIDVSKLDEDHGLMQALNENYYAKNDSIFSSERIMLANSSKKEMATVEPPLYDFSTFQTGRIKNSHSKVTTQLRSAASIIINEEPNQTVGGTKRFLTNTPLGKANSTSHFKRIVNSYSSKNDRKQSQNLIPWSSSLRALPRQSSRYSRGNSKNSLAQAYRAMPKDSILSKRNIGSRRRLNTKKSNLIPPVFRDSTKDDQTLWLLLKHLKNEQSSRLPNVVSRSNLRASTNFADSRKNLRKKVIFVSSYAYVFLDQITKFVFIIAAK